MRGKGGHEVVAAKRVDHEDRAKVGNQHRDFLDTLPRTWPILARRGYKDVRPCCDHDRCDLADIEGWVQRGRYAGRCAPQVAISASGRNGAMTATEGCSSPDKALNKFAACT